VVKILKVAEGMKVDMTATKIKMQSMVAKGRMETARLPKAPGEMTRPKVAKVARSPSRQNLGGNEHQENGSN
jgi:hypothetical protein